MNEEKTTSVDSPLGKSEIDHTGSIVGVVRMDPEKSYSGIGKLLQEYIDESNQDAWEKITAKIDYTFNSLNFALLQLEKELGLSRRIKPRLERGQKLLFKPNLVNPDWIDPQTHGPGAGATACTEWAFVAALMRWFHDKLGISYHQMAVGEAATAIPSATVQFSRMAGEKKTITPEAVIEGKSGDFYGGWGFYFARKYLKEASSPKASDDPMNGYDESLASTYIPVGEAKDKLMVYDLNRIYDDPSKGREVGVPGGVNFKTITLHKVIVGGDPSRPNDLKANPGCILVNVPKLKVHAMTLFTNIIKNLGIGLYPMQSIKAGSGEWDYAVPHRTVPGIKGAIPHQVWHADMDLKTGFPKTDELGRPIIARTGGLTGTMIDIVKAVAGQDIFMIHISDAIEAINVDHQGIGMGVKEKEGMVFAGLDMVATDLLCGRYMFSNVDLKASVEAGMEDGHGGRFPQRVPVPVVDGKNIITRMGFDCPLSRDRVFAAAEGRGLGQTKYYAMGHDLVTDSPLASIQGHLGGLKEGKFSDVFTHSLYFDAFCLPWGLQKTCLSYMEAVDQLTGSSLKRQFLSAFDEDGDGVVTFEDFGKMGAHGILLHLGADYLSKAATETMGYLKGRFSIFSRIIKNSSPQWNEAGSAFLAERHYGSVCLAAFRMSTMGELPDFFVPGMTWGNGKWPSYSTADFAYMGSSLYGPNFPNKIDPMSMYGRALFYADLTQNKGRYAGQIITHPDPESVTKYIADVSGGVSQPLDFTIYVPVGFNNLMGVDIPNIDMTSDPAKIFTASFSRGRETWPEKYL
jgi:hypothetical protein